MLFILHVLFGMVPSASRPTSARHFGVFRVFCGLNFRAFRAFRGSNSMVWLRPKAAPGNLWCLNSP